MPDEDIEAPTGANKPPEQKVKVFPLANIFDPNPVTKGEAANKPNPNNFALVLPISLPNDSVSL